MASNNRVQVDQRTVKAAETSQKILDTFVAARSDPTAGDSAAQLAKSLGVALQQGQKMTDQWNEEEAQKGASAFATGVLEDGSKINKGELEKTASHHFMRGFNVAEGKSKALEFGMKLDQDWLSDPASQSTDPKAYNDFIQKKLSEEMAQQGNANSDWRAGWTSAVPQVMSHMRAKQLERANALFEEKAIGQLNTELDSHIQMYGSDTNMLKQKIEESLTSANNTARLPYAKGNKIIRDQLVAKALESKNPTLLDALPDKIAKDSDTKLAIMHTKTQIEDFNRAEESRKRAEADRAYRLSADKLADAFITGDQKARSEAISAMSSHPGGKAAVFQMERSHAQMLETDRRRKEALLFEDPTFRNARADILSSIDTDIKRLAYSSNYDSDLSNVRGRLSEEQKAGRITVDDMYDKVMLINRGKVTQPVFREYAPLQEFMAEIKRAVPVNMQTTLLDPKVHSKLLEEERERIRQSTVNLISSAIYAKSKDDPSVLHNYFKMGEIVDPILKHIRDKELDRNPSSFMPTISGGSAVNPIEAAMNKQGK